MKNAYTAVIEIPRGSTRRIHHNYEKTKFIDLGPLKEKIPVNDGVITVNYGYLKGTFNKDDKDEVDVLVYSKKSYKTGEEVVVTPIATFERADKDHKVLAVDTTTQDTKTMEDIPKEELKIITDFVAYHHPITSVLNKKETIDYLEKSKK